MIRITELVKYHGSNRILDGAALTAEAGQITALVGPSGGGKSTLLRCINGLEPFHSGAIEIGSHALIGTGGKPHAPQKLAAIRATVGMVFQQFQLFPHLTALENAMSGPLYAQGKPKGEAEEIAEKLLARVGLAEKANARPAQLSGGQQQRVAIARALAVDPTVMLFDEPTSALDPHMVGEVLDLMRGLAAEGQTIVVVTHDMDFARNAAVVHSMAAGRVAKSGAPGEVLG